MLTAFSVHFINKLQHLPCEGTGDGDFDNRFKSVEKKKKKTENKSTVRTFSMLSVLIGSLFEFDNAITM